LGQINEWFYGWLAGLAPDPSAPGFKKSILRPQPVAGVDWARARHVTPYGELSIHWRKDISTGATGPRAEVKEQGRAARFVVQVTIPPNTESTLYLPCGDAARIFESKRPIAEAVGVTARGRENGCAVFALQPGSYEFEVRE
jgi:alpha-L-rhamnosidase